MNAKPVVWSIGGSDSSTGAGIQRDLLTFSDLGVYAGHVITMITAQNTKGIKQCDLCNADVVSAQIDALHSDCPPSAIKLGALGSDSASQVVANYLQRYPTLVVCDPVFFSSTGGALFHTDTLSSLVTRLFPHINLLTPNIQEAERLANMLISNHSDMEIAAQKILKLGVQGVLLKGGHITGSIASDYFCSNEKSFWLHNKKINKLSIRGTGCILSSAITASLALGHDLFDALVIAKMYINQEIRNSYLVTNNVYVAQHNGWPSNQLDLPWITSRAGQKQFQFSKIMGEPIGFYPIVDSYAWVEKLVTWGVKSIQLRIKEKSAGILEHAIQQSIELCEREKVRLFINDYWELAIKYGAYGVHLGQEDMRSADFDALYQSGIRLGVSTHCFYEVARAHAYCPSYLAFGPVYETYTKKMQFTPRGFKQLNYWSKLLTYPLVAIGGINLERHSQVLSAGVNGVSVVSAVTKSHMPQKVVQQFLNQYEDAGYVNC